MWFWDKYKIGSEVVKLLEAGALTVFVEPYDDKKVAVIGKFYESKMENIRKLFPSATIKTKKGYAYVRFELKI